MNATRDTRSEAARFEWQVHRLRTRLASAWQRECGPATIRRIERMLEHRWSLLDRARHTRCRPQPA